MGYSNGAPRFEESKEETSALGEESLRLKKQRDGRKSLLLLSLLLLSVRLVFNLISFCLSSAKGLSEGPLGFAELEEEGENPDPHVEESLTPGRKKKEVSTPE